MSNSWPYHFSQQPMLACPKESAISVLTMCIKKGEFLIEKSNQELLRIIRQIQTSGWESLAYGDLRDEVKKLEVVISWHEENKILLTFMFKEKSVAENYPSRNYYDKNEIVHALDYLRFVQSLAEISPTQVNSAIDFINVHHERPIKILFLAANPKDTNRLRLDEEIRAIDFSLQQSKFRQQFELEQHWAVRAKDLQSYLLRHTPDIVHFSGHGNRLGEISLEDDFGTSKPVPESTLSTLFDLLKDNIRCVILNACFSESQAKAIAEHIDCVIGMSSTIGDLAAINFAAAFYQAIAFGRDVKTAFELGCFQIDLENLGEMDIPKLIATRTNPNNVVFV